MNPDRPFVLWFTGLSGAGKTTLADGVYEELVSRGCSVERLDGDIVRKIFPQTGFDRTSRDTHIRRIGYQAGRMENHGITVIASFISPYRESRRFVRDHCRNYIEVYVSTPLEECEKRDPKGLYRRARAGEIEDFTGISDPYEKPEEPEIEIDTTGKTIETSVHEVLRKLEELP